MLALSLAMLFGISSISIFNMRTIALDKPHKNLLSLAMCSSNAVFAFAIALFMLRNDFLIELVVVLQDPRMISLVVFELLAFLCARRNFAYNHNNMTAINFSMFMSVVYVPVMAFFFTDILGFTQTLRLEYSSNVEFFLFVGSMLLLVVFFFANKSFSHVNHWRYLALTPVMLSVCMFLGSKLNQTYNGFLVFMIIAFCNSCVFTFLVIKRRECSELNKETRRNIMLVLTASMAFVPLNTMALSLIAVEFFTILKRIAQIVCGSMFDLLSSKNKSISVRDSFIVAAMFALGVTFYLLRG